MATIFKYKDKYYQTTNLEKKLKRLKISSSEIEILFEGELNQEELEQKFLELTKAKKEITSESWHNVKTYKFYNSKTKSTIISIYDNLDNLKGILDNINDYVRI